MPKSTNKQQHKKKQQTKSHQSLQLETNSKSKITKQSISDIKTNLIKTQLKAFIKGTQSNDFIEIKSHCKNLINVCQITNRTTTTQIFNWLNSQLLKIPNIKNIPNIQTKQQKTTE